MPERGSRTSTTVSSAWSRSSASVCWCANFLPRSTAWSRQERSAAIATPPFACTRPFSTRSIRRTCSPCPTTPSFPAPIAVSDCAAGDLVLRALVDKDLRLLLLKSSYRFSVLLIVATMLVSTALGLVRHRRNQDAWAQWQQERYHSLAQAAHPWSVFGPGIVQSFGP